MDILLAIGNYLLPYLLLFVKLLIGFLIIIANMNWQGKTQISQMNAIDFVGNFVLGGIIGGIIYNTDLAFWQYISSLIVGIALINSLNWLVHKTNFFRAFAGASPIVLIRDGQFHVESINDKRNKIDIACIASSLRIAGHMSFAEINFLQIEPNGQLTILTKDQGFHLPGKLIFMNGCVCYSELKDLGKDEDWFVQKMKHFGLEDYSKVFLVEYWNGQFIIVHKDGSVINNSKTA
ncbi:YetF domain-containing protein [Pseudomonas sp. F1_0610]|uniref:DUF421 domain-containing protein n=1 Tax=Pseudomonas sp. F1_0610 TaxID=3114284 RepID=UPI0039C1BE59